MRSRTAPTARKTSAAQSRYTSRKMVHAQTARGLLRDIWGRLECMVSPQRSCGGRLLNCPQPSLALEGLGAIPLPLDGKFCNEVIEICTSDDNVSVLNSIPATKIILGSRWNDYLGQQLEKVAHNLGFIESTLPRLVLISLQLVSIGDGYSNHVSDDLKEGGVGWFVVYLPTLFRGGELSVRTGNSGEDTYDFSRDSDCYFHFVASKDSSIFKWKGVREGVQVRLMYEIVVTENSGKEIESLRKVSMIWEEEEAKAARPQVLVVALDDVYRGNDMTFEKLRGRDGELVRLIREANELEIRLGLQTCTSRGIEDGNGVQVRSWIDEKNNSLAPPKHCLEIRSLRDGVVGDRNHFRAAEVDSSILTTSTLVDIRNADRIFYRSIIVFWPKAFTSHLETTWSEEENRVKAQIDKQIEYDSDSNGERGKSVKRKYREHVQAMDELDGCRRELFEGFGTGEAVPQKKRRRGREGESEPRERKEERLVEPVCIDLCDADDDEEEKGI